VALSASGGSSGRTIHYSTDGGETWSSVVGDDATVEISADGAHHFLYYASNALGSGLTSDAGYVNIDKTAPVTTVSGVSYEWRMAPVTVTLDALDSLSGIATTQYRLRGTAAWVAYSSPFTVSAPGTWVYQCRSTDKAGNVGLATTFTVRIAGKPMINRLNPSFGSRGATTMITGKFFGLTHGVVKFGTKTCLKYVSWSATQIKCKVPATAKYGAVKVTVTTAAGKSNAKSFTVKR